MENSNRGKSPGQDIPDTDYAWAAGIIDGEGSFTIHQFKADGKMKRYIAIHVSNTQVPMLERLREIIGGSIYKGKKYHNWRTIWKWQVSGPTSVSRAIEKILPYLCNKKQEANLVLKYFSLDRYGRPTKNNPHREEIIKFRNDIVRSVKEEKMREYV